MNRTHILIAATAAAAVSTPALAGSYEPAPVEPVVAAPAPVVGNDWTGAYGGLSLGMGKVETTDDQDDAVYGLHAGYDYDFGTFVLGGEAEYQARDMGSNGAYDSARLKARMGYDLGETLVYGVVGASLIDDETGYGVGIGAEHMVTDTVSVGAEYLYEEISDFDNTSGDLTANTLTARVNYRF